MKKTIIQELIQEKKKVIIDFLKSIFYKKESEVKEYINNFLNIIFKNYSLYEYEGEFWYINTTTKKFLFFINQKNILLYNSHFFHLMNNYLNIDRNEFIDVIKSILKNNLINVRFIYEDMEGNQFIEKIDLIEKTSKKTNKVWKNENFTLSL